MAEAPAVERMYFNYTEAEKYTGLHRVTLWRAVRDGHLKAAGFGTAVRFNRDELDRFMQSRNR